jgi:hypothetical protein
MAQIRKILLCATIMSLYATTSTALADSARKMPWERQQNEILPALDTEIFLDAIKIAAPKEAKEPFKLESRIPALSFYPCGNCHDSAADGIPGNTDTTAHWNIELNHAPAVLNSCTFCHVKSDPSKLIVLGGETVEIEHAYVLCEKCHYNAARDWRGGAHGKRLGNYTGLRVIKNCTGCHNPHSPKFESRLPKTMTQFPKNGLR